MVGLSVVTGKAIEALDLYCRKASAKTLRKLAFSVGAPLGTNKSSLRMNIMGQIWPLEELRCRKLANGKVSVTSIDLGISNFAYSKFEIAMEDNLPCLTAWNKIQLEEKFLPIQNQKMTLQPSQTSKVVYELCEFLTSKEHLPDMYTIERQRARSMSSRMVLEPILKVNILEQMLFSSLSTKQKYYPEKDLKYLVVSSDPQRMTAYWNEFLAESTKKLKVKVSEGSPSVASSNRISKSIKVSIVKKILQGSIGFDEHNMIGLTPFWRGRLAVVIPGKPNFKLCDCVPLDSTSGARKDDDLADCFLHGLAWMEWLRFYEQIREIVTKKSGKYDQEVLAEFNLHIKNNKLDLQSFYAAIRNA